MDSDTSAEVEAGVKAEARAGAEPGTAPGAGLPELSNWQVQMRLAHVEAPYFEGARLLIAGDCTAFASPQVHQDFIKGRITLIGGTI